MSLHSAPSTNVPPIHHRSLWSGIQLVSEAGETPRISDTTIQTMEGLPTSFKEVEKRIPMASL